MATLTIEEAAEALSRGELVGVPTDTVYGIAADPFHQEAIRRLFEIKGRPDLKPVAVLVADIDQGQDLAAFNDVAHELAAKHWPGGVTLVLPRLGTAPDWLGDTTRRTIGLRCPDHPVARALLRLTGPLAVTSANISGQPSAMSADEAEELFGADLAGCLEGDSGGGMASTVLDLTQPGPLVLREGPVSDPTRG